MKICLNTFCMTFLHATLDIIYKGLPGPSAYLYARHSQAQSAAHCPPGHTEMWTGYSLLHTEDEGRVHVQDLGSTGSCLRRYIYIYIFIVS